MMFSYDITKRKIMVRANTCRSHYKSFERIGKFIFPVFSFSLYFIHVVETPSRILIPILSCKYRFSIFVDLIKMTRRVSSYLSLLLFFFYETQRRNSTSQFSHREERSKKARLSSTLFPSLSLEDNRIE